ncbi:HNH endonuclease signature motif containing protein [Serratia fonticola]|uniref:HNH endonuclease signature motif containing protein n=1 Tax=Serratia fonticola TaxID=47917 RepID=UPI000E0EA964|nr:HNH endonuclease signature motif containing protein [Serratia fonticola]RDL25101.1 HNH endonuclease [Serratia fonticola]
MANWTEQDIQDVWEKAEIVSKYDKEKHRKDQCGAWMEREKYGDRNSLYGWEIDHIKTVSKGGTNALSNLRPLQWENNVGRSDGRLKPIVTSEGNKNIRLSATDNIA